MFQILQPFPGPKEWLEVAARWGVDVQAGVSTRAAAALVAL